MTDVEKRAAARAFASFWQGKGCKKGESQKHRFSLLTNVFGVTDVEEAMAYYVINKISGKMEL